MTSHQCPECGARYAEGSDSCAERFNQLLALDHSRREPWGSRHGQAFAAFALQHPAQYAASLDTAWAALYRIYRLNERPLEVFTALRKPTGRAATASVPPRPPSSVRPAITIADLKDFAPDTYAARLDEWCRATLHAYGHAMA